MFLNASKVTPERIPESTKNEQTKNAPCHRGLILEVPEQPRIPQIMQMASNADLKQQNEPKVNRHIKT